jgi:phasin family protein
VRNSGQGRAGGRCLKKGEHHQIMNMLQRSILPLWQGETTMTTQEPSDLTDLVKRLDPMALSEKYKEFLGKFGLPNLDTKALIETQSKNMQALTDANRAILESTRSLFQRQIQMMQQVFEETSEAVKSLAGSANPQEAAEKQIKLIEDSVSKTLANFSEISELVRKTQDETTKRVTDRFNESMAELHASIAELKPKDK